MIAEVRHRKISLFIIMGLLLAGVILMSLAWGQVQVPVAAMFGVLGNQVGLPGFQNMALTPEQTAVIWHIRLPRILVGVLVGAALGVSGAVLQGVFGNSLADPGIIGVSSGAALGAVTAIALGVTANSIYYMPFFALAGSVLAVAITVSLTMRAGKIPVMTLLLAGVAVSMLLGAITSGILTFMNEYRLREFLFWMVGGLDYRRWEHVYLAVGPVLCGILVLCFLARHLNVLVLGEQEARAVGVPVAALRLILLFIAAVTTATAVCVSGTIGFVGLIVPHMMRMLLGPEHRILLPACALAGALFLVGCDTLGRLIIPPAEIRVGIMTALLGTPYFLFLLRRSHQGGES
jgi:iron complex transport system permease protein